MKSRMLALCITGLLGQAGCGGALESEATGGEETLAESSQAIRGHVVSFNGDASSDLLWREQSTGNMGTWFLNGPVLSGSAAMAAISPSLMVQAASDFGGPTTDPDLVYHSTTAAGGETVRFTDSGPVLLGATSISPVLPSSAWYVAASGDFNLDGRTDLVVHNRLTGQYFYRYMNGVSSLGNSAALSRALPWHIVGAADMNGDGRTDLLWRNKSTGQNEIALMNNTAVLGSVALPFQSLAFYVGATADYTGDGRNDIVWHNPGSGQVLLWWMNGTSLSNTSTIGVMGSGCPAWFSQSTPPPATYGCWYLVGPR